MATLIPRWGIYYRMMAEWQLGGNLPSSENKNAATSYWWGMKAGVLDVVLSGRFDPYAARLVSEFRSALGAEDYSPFEGQLRDQAGALRCEAERRLTPAEILCMDYLLDNVVGDFPGQEVLEDSARPVVKLQGIHGDMKPETISFSRD